MIFKTKLKDATSGFTIIELLIATSVLSVVLLLVTSGIIRIGQNYYKNIISVQTQETTRTVSEDISRTIQLARGVKKDGNPSQFCIGDTRYTYNLNTKVDTSNALAPKALLSERISPTDACAGAPGSGAIELLGNNMRLLKFNVTPVAQEAGVVDQKTWRVDIRVAYGDSDLLTAYDDQGNQVSDPASANCKSGVAGSSFCSVAQLDTQVKRRLIGDVQ